MANKRTGIRILTVLIAVAAVVGAAAWYKLLRPVPQVLADDTMVEYFKYGSIGTEDAAGLPYWIWMVLPKVFPEYLPRPGGWASLGFTWEQGRPMPIGFSKKTIGFERVGINCALCHSGSVRRTPTGVPTALPGAPATSVDALGYQRFLFQCASDPRFNADNILGAIGAIYDMPLIDRLLYRYLLIPATRKALLEQQEAFVWTDIRPVWGRGRIDPFNPVKVALLDVDPGDTIGNADMMPIWNLRPKVQGGMAFHWDGLNTDLTEIFISSALGDGATPKSLPMERIDALQEWAMDLEPPKLEDFFPGTVDAALARSGEPVFAANCAQCHGPGGANTGNVRKVDGDDWAGAPPDRHRADMWTKEAADAYNEYGEKYDWDFDNFRSTTAYLSPRLDGIWARAPYLHNGSVPYLGEMLERPENRTKVFYRGFDLYDPVRMGFVAEGELAERFGFRFDVSVVGNSNQGHVWGVDLSADDKRALLEYLKTL